MSFKKDFHILGCFTTYLTNEGVVPYQAAMKIRFIVTYAYIREKIRFCKQYLFEKLGVNSFI
jgi:hypothetical protein